MAIILNRVILRYFHMKLITTAKTALDTHKKKDIRYLYNHTCVYIYWSTLYSK